MFCKVVKSVYICISKQRKANLRPCQIVGNSEIIAAPEDDNRQEGGEKQFFSKRFAKLKNIPTFVIEKQ